MANAANARRFGTVGCQTHHVELMNATLHTLEYSDLTTDECNDWTDVVLQEQYARVCQLADREDFLCSVGRLSVTGQF